MDWRKITYGGLATVVLLLVIGAMVALLLSSSTLKRMSPVIISTTPSNKTQATSMTTTTATTKTTTRSTTLPATTQLTPSKTTTMTPPPRPTRPISKECLATQLRPDLNSMQVKNMVSKQEDALANLVGYFELNGTYFPIELERMDIFYKSGSDRFVELRSGCVIFGLYYQYVTEYEIPSILYLSIDMSIYDELSGKFVEVCQLNDFAFGHPAKQRLSCTQQQSHVCIEGASQRHNLLLKSFELELDMNKEDARKKKFVKQAFGESCSRWSS
jgi:hypothetical protein